MYPATARTVTDAGGHYVIALKANQPTLMAAADTALFAAGAALAGVEETTRGHGRIERRLVQVVHATHRKDNDTDDTDDTARAGTGSLAVLNFPAVTAVVRVTRWTKASTEKVWASKETTLLLTSLPRHLATPHVLAALVRGHWSVEVMHWVRDVGFAEDASTVHSGHGPHNLATVRNIVMTLITAIGGATAATRRQAATTHAAALALITGRLKPDKPRT